MAAAITRAKANDPAIEVELVAGARGAFEVFKDGALVFSKLTRGRFPSSEDEVLQAL